MRVRLLSAIVFGLALAATASAQDANPAPAAGQTPSQGAGSGGGQGQGEGQRGVRGGWGGGGMMGRGLTGAVTAVAADHYTIKTDSGETYTVHFSANTRILKQQAGMRERGPGAEGGERGGNPPQALKPSDIKVGDAIAVMGEIDAAAKSVGAVAVFQIDPERARQMRQMQAEMQANYGKTWLAGKVTAIDGVKVTLMGMIDNIPHTFVADENTTFRKRRDPITLADVQVGDTVRVEGAPKDGVFAATAVNVMGMTPGGTPTVPRETQPAPRPQ
jgi:hypothetical protein